MAARSANQLASQGNTTRHTPHSTHSNLQCAVRRSVRGLYSHLVGEPVCVSVCCQKTQMHGPNARPINGCRVTLCSILVTNRVASVAAHWRARLKKREGITWTVGWSNTLGRRVGVWVSGLSENIQNVTGGLEPFAQHKVLSTQGQCQSQSQ